LKPKKPAEIRLKIARALLDAGRKDDAKAAVDEILDVDPDHPEAKALREEIGRPEAG